MRHLCIRVPFYTLSLTQLSSHICIYDSLVPEEEERVGKEGFSGTWTWDSKLGARSHRTLRCLKRLVFVMSEFRPS